MATRDRVFIKSTVPSGLLQCLGDGDDGDKRSCVDSNDSARMMLMGTC